MQVLIADDNHFYRCVLKSALPQWGYEVIEATDGQKAWEILREESSPKLAILDWMMPKMEGPEVCARLRAVPRFEPTYVIMLTSHDGKSNAVRALESGADDFVTKPFDREELRARLQVGRRIVGLQTSETVMYSFARAVEGKSLYTRGHSDRVQQYSLALGQAVSLSTGDLQKIRRGAILHDIGKISVPDTVLDKPGPLTTEEYELIKRHPVDGARMVEPLESVRDLIPLIRWHHERLNGSGYPDGLEGDEIPLLVRIVSIADVYDALRSDRPYRRGLPHQKCLEILRNEAAAGGLDRELVELYCQLPVSDSATISPSLMNT